MDDPVPLSSSEDALWRAFAQVLHVLPRTLDSSLKVQGHISSPEYAALANLADNRPDGLRVNELAALIGLSPSRASRLADSLATRGEVERRQGTDDGRSQRLTITERGAERVTSAWPSHLANVRRYVLDHIDPCDYESLIRAFRAIVEAN
jgi:DNA-binding MarR family transcriptional regulator